MNLLRIYRQLMTNAQELRGKEPYKKGRKTRPNSHVEHHHIIPRCWADSSDDADNMAWLTHREHYLAHWILARLEAKEHGMNGAMFSAFAVMSITARNGREFADARALGHIKRAENIARKKTDTQEYIDELLNAGCTLEEAKAKAAEYAKALAAFERDRLPWESEWDVPPADILKLRWSFFVGRGKNKAEVVYRANQLPADIDPAKVQACCVGTQTRHRGYTWTQRGMLGIPLEAHWLAEYRARIRKQRESTNGLS